MKKDEEATLDGFSPSKLGRWKRRKLRIEIMALNLACIFFGADRLIKYEIARVYDLDHFEEIFLIKWLILF